MQFDTSKAQRKALDVLGIQYDPRISREYAAELLTKVGVSGDGVPAGHTWRTAAKLSDEELRNALRPRSLETDEALAILGFHIDHDWDKIRDFIRRQYRAAQDTAERIAALDLSKQEDVRTFHLLIGALQSEIRMARETERTLLQNKQELTELSSLVAHEA